MNQIKRLYHIITWAPYNLIFKFAKKKGSFLNLNLKKIGINKSFKFNLLEEDNGLSKDLKIYGFREPLNLKYSYNFIDEQDKVLDIGANIGLFSLLSCKAKEIISIEPLKECLPVLKKNLKENGLSNKSKVINMAVGKEGILTLKKEDKMNLSRIVENKDVGVKVKSKKLDYFVDKFDANVLRMDVEGYEYEILYKKIPKRINKIAIEFHTCYLKEKKSFELLNYFQEQGFKVKYFIEDLPIRLYPFYLILRKLHLLNFFTYVKRNKEPIELLKYIFKGRDVKYLFLER